MPHLSHNHQVKTFFNQPQVYRAYNSNIIIRSMIVRKLLGHVENATILDIGCGDGSIGLQFASANNHLVLADLSPKMLAIAKEHTPPHLFHHVHYYEGDFHEIDTPNKFDIVLCLGVLAHVPSVSVALEKAVHLTKPGGQLIIQFTDEGQWLGYLLHVAGQLREAFGIHYRHRLNRISDNLIKALALSIGLQLLQEKHYWPQLPGMGKWPFDWSYRYQLYTLKHKFLSRFGSERISLFYKQDAHINAN